MSDTQQSEKVCAYLRSFQGWVPTLKIAKEVCGKSATKKSVNKTLYDLERRGLVSKKCEENGGNPQWKILDASCPVEDDRQSANEYVGIILDNPSGGVAARTTEQNQDTK